MMETTPKRKPYIGLIGLVLAVIFCPVAVCTINTNYWAITAGLATLGMLILIYALITGNVKLFG